MKVRAHSLGQKWQRVDSSFTDVYSRLIARSRPDEGGDAAPLTHAQRLHGRADRARLAGVRVDEDLGAGTRSLM
jgi:hypothetical protein